MAEISLKSLTGQVASLARDTETIKEHVKDIRDSICGNGQLISAIEYMSESVGDIKSKMGLTGSKPASHNDLKVQKDLNKSMDNMSKTLNKILGKSGSLNINKDSGPNLKSLSKKLDKILDQLKKMDRRSRRKSSVDSKGLTRESFKPGRNRKDPAMESLSASLGIMGKLKGIEMKDFRQSQRKLKYLDKIIEGSKNLFKKFKDKKESEEILGFMDSSLDIINKMKEINLSSKIAKRGVKVIDALYFGKKKDGGLVGVYRKLYKDRDKVKAGEKLTAMMLKSTGSILLMCISLTAIAVLSIPAMLGALLAQGVVYITLGIFKVLSKRKTKTDVRKGALTLVSMSTSLVAFALGIGAMYKLTKGMTLKDVGIMAASIGGVALAMAGIGLLAIPIALGGVATLVISGSLAILGLALTGWAKMNPEPAVNNIKLAMQGIKDALGFGDGENLLKNGKDILKNLVIIRKSTRTIKAIYRAIKPWEDLNAEKSIDKVKYTLNKLLTVFDDVKGLKNGKEGLKKLRILKRASRSLKSIYRSLKNWAELDVPKTVKNIDRTIQALIDVFNETKGKKINKRGESRLKTLKKAAKSLGSIYRSLKNWAKLDVDKTAANIDRAIQKLIDVFNDTKGQKINKKGTNRLKTLKKGAKSLKSIYRSLKNWAKLDSDKTVNNIKVAMQGIKDILVDADALKKNSVSFHKFSTKFKSSMDILRGSLIGTRRFREFTESGFTENMERIVEAVNTVDMSKASITLDLLNSFSKMKTNKAMDKLVDAINKFTKACNEMSKSIDNLEDISSFGAVGGATESVTTPVPVQTGNGFAITNAQELADALAKVLRTMSVNINPNDLDINLIVDGVSGKSIRLTLQD